MWPVNDAYRERFFVPDLSPWQRQQLKGFSPEIVFVAESPHVSEVEPDDVLARRPLCGRAGFEWWKMIAALTGVPYKDTELESLLGLCRAAGLSVMNAVQFPLDPKIVAHCGPEADPITHLGFAKAAPASYKKLKSGKEVQSALEALRVRLTHSSVRALPVVSLGNDAKWFVEQVLREAPARHAATIPHPSAWWRRGGAFRERARGQLTELLSVGSRAGRPRSHTEALGGSVRSPG